MSDEIVSLFALMDAHLSKTALNEAPSENDENNPTNSSSHTLLSGPPRSKLAIPKFFPGNSPMKDFLAEKISMTLAKAKQKEEEEQRKIVEEMRMLEINENHDMQSIKHETKNIESNSEQEYLIDLTSSIIRQPKAGETPGKSQANKNTVGTCQKDLFTSQLDLTPSKSVPLCITSFSAMGQYNTSESSYIFDDSIPSQSTSDDHLEENNTLLMPNVEWNGEYEEPPMSEEEENRLKMKQKEALWIEEELRKMRIRHEQEYPPLHLLDEMMPQPKPTRQRPQPVVKDRLSKRLLFDKETCLYKEWDPTLPCSTDISHILKSSIKKGKCSNFGKVLCSRVRPSHKTFIPYPRQKLTSKIVRFDFKTKSPADIYKENQTSLIKNQNKTKLPLRLMLDLMECM